MGWNYIRNKLFWIFIIFCLLLSGCTIWDHLTGNVECPPDEYCLDLTERMKVLSSLKPIKGWKVRGCFHSKQADPTSVGEYMYCEHCDKDANQMWMIYNYDNETWSLKEQNWHDICGTPFNFKK
jgi:hypothetical protein